MKRGLTVSLMAAVLAAPIVGAQQADPLYSLDPTYRSQIEQILDSAKLAALPTSLLRSKALEGVAKHASGSAVVTEVRKLFKCVKQSASELGSADTQAVEAGADALCGQVLSPDELKQFRTTNQNRSAVVALTYLSDLIQYKGVKRDDATSAFLKLWQAGASDGEFKGLWQHVDQDILSGVNPGTALENRVREIPGRPRPPDQRP